MLGKELGETGAQIPEIGLGTWQYTSGPGPLRKGLEAGAYLVDTAESYGTEPAVAEAIAGRRERVFLATKVSPAHFRKRDVIKAADASLRRLRTDLIDLYQLHEPSGSIPLEETLGAMEELVDAGKVRFVGVSNFSLAQLKQAQSAMHRHPIVSNQVRYNLIDRTISDELLPYCQAHHITVIAYSPLGRGLQHILDCDASGALKQIGDALGRTQSQVALNWCIAQTGVVAIPGSNSESHIVENCGASGWRLNPEQLRELDQKIGFRRRSGLEIFLRRRLPPSCKKGIQRLVRSLPRSLRRGVS
jgi:diketogulonate reductase-like aldo/keto reductase